MAIVQSKNIVYRKAGAHAFMIAFLALIMFPLLMVVAISFRVGNYSVGDLIPTPANSTLDHWKLALGISLTQMSRQSGADLHFIDDGNGKVIIYASENGKGSFSAFSTSAFTPSEAAKLSPDNPIVINGQYNPEEYDASRFKSNNEALDLEKQLSKKLVVEIPSTGGQGKDRYIIDAVNRDSTQFGVYKELTIKPPFPVLTWLWNSIKVALITAFLIICLSTTSAYAFARLRFKGKGFILNSMLIFQMFPSVLALVAIYALFDKIGQYVPWLGLNTHGGLILSYMGGIALHIWTVKGYFETIDGSLEEAAAIDGATPWQAFYMILLPLSVPILAVVFILAFIGTITEVPVASVLLMDVDKLTLAVGSQQYLYPQNYLWGDFAAAAVMSGLPITIVFLAAQRYLVGGLTAGGVKG